MNTATAAVMSGDTVAIAIARVENAWSVCASKYRATLRPVMTRSMAARSKTVAMMRTGTVRHVGKSTRSPTHNSQAVRDNTLQIVGASNPRGIQQLSVGDGAERAPPSRFRDGHVYEYRQIKLRVERMAGDSWLEIRKASIQEGRHLTS